jgi:spore maturation protein CgeB
VRIVMFYHSLSSDWNHGNAHFLRGIASELLGRGHDVRVYEDENAWSAANLVQEYGLGELERFRTVYPALHSERYDPQTLDLDEALQACDLVLVHEWNSPELVARIGAHRAHHGGYTLLFHDTHHRGITDPSAMSALDLTSYDGVLAFGNALRQVYVRRRWAEKVWNWHEAADCNVFHPVSQTEQQADSQYDGDLVWIGNWGDDERKEELREFLLGPVRELGLKARVYGVRYPDSALRELADAGIEYAGWLPNYKVPQVFSRFRVTLHVPRRPYVKALPGIPTIRVFEALACGIPLVCSYWPDVEHLFTPGSDYLVAQDGVEMKRHISNLLANPVRARDQAARGLRTILKRHTCAHRVDELLHIVSSIHSACAGAVA